MKRPRCLMCGKKCKVMAYAGEPTCCQRCSEALAAKRAPARMATTNGYHLGGRLAVRRVER